MQIGKAARSNGSHIKSRLKMEPHGVFKEVTKQCTNKDHYQSVRVRWTEPQDEPALMRNPRTTLERKNSLCIRRNFGAAQEQACETCRMLRGRGHHGSQHANATEFFRSESRNLLA